MTSSEVGIQGGCLSRRPGGPQPAASSDLHCNVSGPVPSAVRVSVHTVSSSI